MAAETIAAAFAQDHFCRSPKKKLMPAYSGITLPAVVTLEDPAASWKGPPAGSEPQNFAQNPAGAAGGGGPGQPGGGPPAVPDSPPPSAVPAAAVDPVDREAGLEAVPAAAEVRLPASKDRPSTPVRPPEPPRRPVKPRPTAAQGKDRLPDPPRRSTPPRPLRLNAGGFPPPPPNSAGPPYNGPTGPFGSPSAGGGGGAPFGRPASSGPPFVPSGAAAAPGNHFQHFGPGFGMPPGSPFGPGPPPPGHPMGGPPMEPGPPGHGLMGRQMGGPIAVEQGFVDGVHITLDHTVKIYIY
ncbi:unnamed protein product, partial [Callosobruchus maculatus]